MPGRPFRSLSGLSGPQPTFAAQGKAKASQWGTKRAKAGRRVSRMDAFPDGQGSRLVESEERASSDDTEARPKRPPRSNSGAGKQARALAASRRASTSRAEPVEDRGAADDESEVSSVSSHSSDDEPDSDDPDRESSKAVRTRDKVRKAREALRRSGDRTAAGQGREETEMEKVRRIRAAAAEKRVQTAKVIVLDGTDTEEERRYQEDQARETQASRRRSVTDPPRVNGKGKGKARPGSTGRRLGDETDSADEVSDDLAGTADPAGAPRRASSSRETPPGSTSKARRMATTSRSREDTRYEPAASGSRPGDNSGSRLFNPSPSDGSDLDADLVDPALLGTSRAPTKRSRQARDTPTDGSGDRRGRTNRTANGSRSARLERSPPRHRGSKTTRTRKRVVSARSSPSVPDSDSDEATLSRRKSRPVPKLPAFVDPRAELARRKARELSDPPTDAFSSSDGLGESSEEETGNRKRRKRKGPGTYKRGEDDFLDELDKIERGMKARKREYREQRRPGYSNPRKN